MSAVDQSTALEQKVERLSAQLSAIGNEHVPAAL